MRKLVITLILGLHMFVPHLLLAHENVTVARQNCKRYLADEKFYKRAADHAFNDEKKYSFTFPNTTWFSQKARDARMDYGLCMAGVPLRDYN